MGGSGGSPAESTTEDFASDVQAGIAFLKDRGEIDPARIGLIGHSEGGIIAPLVASRSDAVAFVIMLAGPGVPGDEILYLQTKLIALAAGVDEETLAGALEAHRELQARNFEEAIELLLEHEADVNAPGFDKQTPLHLAAEEAHNETVSLLLKRGLLQRLA